MRIMLGVCLFVAGYVAWRISNVLKARSQKLSEMPAPGGAGQGKLAALFAPRSKALAARQADLEARRRRLIAEGKLAAEEAPPPAPEPEAAPPPPSASTNVKDRMALRRERVRKAKEEGKI
jgi:hypothetical protein